MRIRMFLGADLDNNKIPERTIETLCAEFAKDQNIEITDDNPDVIHFFGAWTPSAQNVAKDAHMKYIATVHTPLGSLSPWQPRSSANVKLTSRCTAIVASGQMELELIDDGTSRKLTNILNPVVTNTTTPEKMASEYKDVYIKYIRVNDDKLWEDIVRKVGMIRESDEMILNICKNLLYAQCLATRRNIPHTFINNLSNLLTNSNYDEDRLGEVLKLINLYHFTQRLEYILREKSGLTEGFMPLPMKDDKATHQMLTLITDYKK